MNLSEERKKTILMVVGSIFLQAAFMVSDVVRWYLGVYWELDEAIQPLFWTFVGILAFFGVLYAILRHVEKALTLAILLTFIFFLLGHLASEMSVPAALLVQAGLAGTVIFFTLRSLAFCRGIFFVITVAMLICTSFYGAQIAKFSWSKRYDLSGMPPRQALLDKKDMPAAYADSTKYPDIYFIIFDAYAANRTLKRLFDFDNTPFLNELQKRGFYQAADSRSYYIQTMLSVSSTLNANYLQDDIILPNSDSKDRRPAIDYFLHPRVPRFLQSLGYDLAWFSTGYAQDYSFNPDFHDINAPDVEVTMAEYMMARTPVHQILTYIFGGDRAFLNSYREEYQSIRAVIEATHKRAQEKADRPKFTYVHLLQPHPPFVCNRDGDFSSYRNLSPFYHADGMGNPYGHLYEGGWREFYKKAYIENLECANKEAIGIADDIIAHRTDRPVVIFMMADHGSRLNVHFHSAEETDQDEAFHIFNATYFSDGDYKEFTQDISPVNMMRVTLNKYFGLKLEKLRDRQWYSEWGRPYDLKEMTGRLADSRP